MSMVSYPRYLTLLAALLLSTVATLAQTIQIDSGYTWRAYNGTVAPTCESGKLCHFYPTQSWEANYKEFAAWRSATNGDANTATAFLNFRVMFPNGYNKNDHNKKYPVILFLHGAGESGRVWQGRFNYTQDNPLYDNNSRSTIHGGREHRDAVLRSPTDPRAFPGIVIFPQVSYSGAWSDSFNNGILSQNQEFVVAFLEHIVANYNGDINRIAVHGLSNGAKGTWDIAMKRPDLFSAIQPFSGVPIEPDPNVAANILLTTPIRLYQGGLDTNPKPGGAETTLAAFTSRGANPEYFLYPNLGHNVWTTAMARTDFFSWILAQDKRKIYIFGGSNALCDEPGATKKLGFSAGFLRYRWKKDGAYLPNDTTRYLTTSTTGTYTVEFMRKDLQWYESFPTTIVNQGSSTYSPELTNTGSLILPFTRDDGIVIGSTGQTKTILVAPAGFSEYTWYKNNSPVEVNAVNTRTISSGVGLETDAGNYAVLVKEASGCKSLLSNTVTLVYNTNAANPPNTTGPWHTSPTGGTVTIGPPLNRQTFFAGVSAPTVTILGENKVKLTWTDNVPDEELFEIWRYRRSANGYPGQDWNVIGYVPANATSFIDEGLGLRPNAQYGYMIRAMANNDGRYSLRSTDNPWPVTNDDFKAPTAPTDLTVIGFTHNSITLSWTASTDNDVVHRYAAYLGSDSVGISQVNDINTPSDKDQTDGRPAPATTYTFTGLEPNTAYMLNVRAIDFQGNQSGFPMAVWATTAPSQSGLNFKYYEATFSSPPNLNNLTPKDQGIVPLSGIDAFDVSRRGTRTDNYGFIYSGYIQILEAGIHTFSLKSKDGSRLYLNNNSTPTVNNYTIHAPQTVSGNYNFPAPGLYAIKVEYFESTDSGEILEVQYTTPTEGLQFIPLSRLTTTPPPTPIVYYSKPTVNLQDLSTWGMNTDGSGTAPANFTDANQFFEIRNRATADLNASWTVSGTSSRVIVGNGVILNLNAALAGKLYANANSTINLNHASLPTLVQLDPTSTVNMMVGGTIPNAVFGNLRLQTAATTKTLPTSSTQVAGNFTVDNNVTLAGNPVNESTLSVGGNITFTSTSGVPPSASNRYSVLLTGANNHIIKTGGNDLSLYALELDINAIATLDFETPSVKTLTIGTANGSGGLILRAGAQLNLGNHNLVINGGLGANPGGDNGELSVNGGTITMATTSTQGSNLAFNAGNNLIKDLTLGLGSNGRLTLLNPSQLQNLMSLNSGTVTIADNLKLLSTASGTARIGPIANGSRINGNVSVQRYMDGEGRIYRYISSPVKEATVADLQAFFPITGNFTGASVISGVTSGPSMFHYVEPAYQQFPAVGGTNLDTLRRGKGYTAFIREATAPTTWELTGEIYQGTIPFTLTGVAVSTENNGWNLLGNPYPAPIKWNGATGGGWTQTGLSNTVYIRENSNGVTSVKSFNGSNGTNGWTTGVIAPGQAFWVRATTASPSLSISESAKQTTDAAFYREGAPANSLKIILKSPTLQDEAVIQFVPDATTAYDASLDGIKLDNSYFNLSSLTSDGKPMVFNLTTPNYCEQEIALRMTNITEGTYELEINGAASILSADQVTFTDHFTQTEKVITDSDQYTFSITSDPASKADGRFTLRMKKPEVVLNQKLTSTAACEAGSPIILVSNSQPGVTYQAFHNGSPVSDEFVSAGGTLELAVNPSLIAFGTTTATVKAGFKGCNNFDLPATVVVQRDTLAIPEIIIGSTSLVASTENATYQWYYNGELAEGQTGREWLSPESGSYVVEVTLSSCIKQSDTIEYVVTGVEESNGGYRLYPNPTRHNVIVTMPTSTDLQRINVITTLGQVIPVNKRKVSDESAELDFSTLPAGLYIVQAGSQRFRVIKE